MKSDHIEGHSSFAPGCIIAYTFRLILPASSLICIAQSNSMDHSGHNFFRWTRLAPTSASHWCMQHGVEWWMSGHCFHLALNDSQPWKLNLATLGGYLSHFYPCDLTNPLLVACSLNFPCSWPLEPRFNIGSKTSQLTVAESIQHYQQFTNAARSQKSPKDLQLACPRAGVHLAAVSNSSVPRSWTDDSSLETQPPILSSTCWRQ